MEQNHSSRFRAPAFGQQQTIRRLSPQPNRRSRERDVESVSTLEDVVEINGSSNDSSSNHSHLHLPFRHSQDDGGQENVAPLHDARGKPILRRGSETVGELFLHPQKQFILHRKRIQEYERQEKEWSEKAATGRSLDVTPDQAIAENQPVIRTIIHFRHLTGDQHIRVTKAIVDQLAQPLSLKDDEILELYTLKDTDDLISFLHKTKRDCSLKVHKGVNFKSVMANKKGNIVDATASPMPEPFLNEKGEPNNAEEEDHAKNNDSTMIPIDLNPNVYLELKYIWPEQEKEEAKKTRRPIFALPDPDLSDEVGQETSATWVELFGDVFYVGWLSAFTHENHIAGSQDVGRYAAWFVVMWWTWCSSALYSARYDTTDVMHHIYKLVELCGLIGMAGASNDMWDNPKGFIIGYMVMKAVLLIEYSVVLWVSALSGSAARWPMLAYVSVNAASMILWGVSLLFQNSITVRFALWYLSIFIEVIVNVLLKRNRQVSLAASHLGERFGLFTIIILGENCMGFITMVAQSDSRIDIVLANMMGVIIIFAFFFMYFDDFSKEILSRVEMSQLWMYLHFPLHLCQVAFGIALTDIITVLQNGWDNQQFTCVHGGTAPAISEANNMSSTSHSLFTALKLETAAPTGEAGECIDPNYVYDAFWIFAGLILCINSLIKLVNTPVWGARWSWIICSSRILNAVVFFSLSAASFENFGGVLGMIGLLLACLLFQSAVDLLD